SGSGFEEGAVVTLKKEGQPDIIVLAVVESATKISGRFNAVETQPGVYDVVVTNPDAQSTTLNAGFTLTVLPAPILNTSKPDLADNMGLIKIELTGNNFLENPVVKIIREGQPDIDATSVMVESPAKIVCDFNLNGVVLGTWSIKVINPDGQTN
ncbi:MAG: hypothetical protein PHX78_12420, partial [bacterium]|nr:hypothetical protein [bacterium]